MNNFGKLHKAKTPNQIHPGSTVVEYFDTFDNVDTSKAFSLLILNNSQVIIGYNMYDFHSIT